MTTSQIQLSKNYVQLYLYETVHRFIKTLIYIKIIHLENKNYFLKVNYSIIILFLEHYFGCNFRTTGCTESDVYFQILY